jgi:hypothetical protein
MADVTADLIDAMAANTGVDLVVDGRVYGGIVPVGAALPFVWLQRRGVEYVGSMEGEDDPWKEFFDVECVADNGITAIELSDAIRAWERAWTQGGTFKLGDRYYSAVTITDAAETYVPRNVDASENLFISSLDLEVCRP